MANKYSLLLIAAVAIIILSAIEAYDWRVAHPIAGITSGAPDPCEQNLPHEKDRYKPSGFHWGPDGHCYSETSYRFSNMNVSCPPGQHPEEEMLPGHVATSGNYVAPHPWYECKPGISYEHRLTRDEWSMETFYRAPDGKITTGKSPEKEYWERCAAASNCYTMGGKNVNGR